uniref:Protein krueppel n=1 Tax=Clastoptera arizonana TaxID=38151 RepID=A0A1B6C732_9HEMI
MSGYRRVNYYELCRLCTSSEGTKIHIFREEGRRRQLPTKIQICLPLQVREDDSLPKIICNHCVDKLESFNDFRESCVNAEAMLEGFRYSDDFSREGKVYVKDESFSKKKTTESEKNTMKLTAAPGGSSVPVSVDSLTNLVQTAAIQIVNHPDPDANRVQQYKCTIPMQSSAVAVGPTIVETSSGEDRYSYRTCTTSNSNNIVSLKTEGTTQTDFNNMNHKPIQKQKDLTRSRESVETEAENGNLYQIHEGPVTTVRVIPQEDAQDMLVQFGFNKDKEGNIFRNDDSLQRTSIAQIGEFLRMKNVNLVDGSIEETQGTSNPTCEHCCKELNTAELITNHHLSCPSISNEDKGSGNFLCEVCSKPFKRKEHLFQHRKLHTGERPYTCDTCGKAFSRKEHLVRHSVSHTGQKTHACDMCSKTFSRKDNLHKHRKTHGIAGPFVCEICGKSFVVKHYYLMHKASHGSLDTPDDPLPYRCDVCNKGFSIKQYLTTHKLRHRKTSRNDGINSEQIEIDPLSTVNTSAILPPNVLHQGPNSTINNTGSIFQVTSGANNTFLCSSSNVETNQLLETYRRLHTT